MRNIKKVLIGFFACLAAAGVGSMKTEAAMNLETDASVAGVSVAINNYYASSLNPEEELAQAFSSGEILAAASKEAEESEQTDETVVVKAMAKSSYDNVAISRVSSYVNVRAEANTSSAVVGKIYNNCAATILANR